MVKDALWRVKGALCNAKDALLERDLQLIDALMVTKTFLESFLLKSTLCSISFCKVISLTAID